MDNKTILSKFMFVLGSLYSILYFLAILVKVCSHVEFSSYDFTFQAVLFTTVLGLSGLCRRKKIFNQSFWKYFSLFQLFFFIAYFYSTSIVAVRINQEFILKVLLILPLFFSIQYYVFKNDDIWFDHGVESMLPSKTSNLVNSAVFCLGLTCITLIYNPFWEEVNPNVTPAQYNSLAYEASLKGDLVAERRFYLQGLKAAKKMHQEESPVVAKIYSNLGIYYQIRGIDSESVKYTYKSLVLYQKLLTEKKISKGSREYSIFADDYCDLGSSDYIKNNELKISYIKTAIGMFEELKENDGLVRCYQSLARIYCKTGQYKMSEATYAKAISIAQNSISYTLLADTYKMYADCLLSQQQDRKAELYAKKSVNIYATHGVKSLVEEQQFGKSLTILAKVYLAQGRCSESNYYLKKGVPMMNKSSGYNNYLNNQLIEQSYKNCVNSAIQKKQARG